MQEDNTREKVITLNQGGTMYIICNTRKGDVEKALGHFPEEQKIEDALIIQVSMKDYKHLKTITASQEMREQVDQRETDYVINLNTRTVHKKDCRYAGKAAIKAAIINLKNTGLWTCKRCL